MFADAIDVVAAIRSYFFSLGRIPRAAALSSFVREKNNGVSLDALAQI